MVWNHAVPMLPGERRIVHAYLRTKGIDPALVAKPQFHLREMR